jgi:dipeptidyl aminopeptidase/acylaminoacyl peptidase
MTTSTRLPVARPSQRTNRRTSLAKKIALSVSLLAVLLAAAYLAVSYVMYDKLSAVTQNPKNAANTPAHFTVTEPDFANFDAAPYQMPNYEAVRFPSRQPGLMLAGWYVPGDAAAPAVLITHGLSSCKCEGANLVLADLLHRHGFNVLLYDLRNHGESDHDNGRTGIGNKEYWDTLGAWDWLNTVKGFAPGRIGVYGASLGAGTTLIAFSQEPRIAALFVDSPYADLYQEINERVAILNTPTFLVPGGLLMARLIDGEDLLAHSPKEAILRDAGRPIFIVHGTADQWISIHHSYDLVALAGQTGANVSTWFPEGRRHVPDALLNLTAEYEQRVTAFFSAALGK